MDCSLPGSSVHGIFQATVLESVAISFSRIFPTQGLNLGLPHCRQMLYHLSRQGRHSCHMWDLIPWPGIKPRPPALGAWSLSHWTTTEVSWVFFFFLTSAEFRYYLVFPLLTKWADIFLSICFKGKVIIAITLQWGDTCSGWTSIHITHLEGPFADCQSPLAALLYVWPPSL